MNFRQSAIEQVSKHLNNGRSTVLVAPTGSGKTRMGIASIGARKTLWIAHRVELVDQATKAIKEHKTTSVQALGDSNAPVQSAQVHVSTIQSMLKRTHLPHAELIVWDECHHAPADSWSQLSEMFPNAIRLGLTATPERGDGKPLEGLFDEMVVAAHTDELIKSGHLVQPWVYRPAHPMKGNLAIDTADAVQDYAQGDSTFVFVHRRERAYQVRNVLDSRGIKASVIECDTHPAYRKLTLQQFSTGETQVLISVDALTEGVDQPRAACAVLARTFGTPGGLIQATGRVLRPYPGKTHARVIDLTGSTYVCGLPDERREFSLSGRGVSLGSGSGLEMGAERAPSMDPEVVGVPLIPVGNAPPVDFDVSRYRTGTTADRWTEYLAAGIKAGRRRLDVAAAYFRQFGEWPPLPNGGR